MDVNGVAAMSNNDKSIGIVIDSCSSQAEVIKILRKYTKDSMTQIRAKLEGKERVLTCPAFDENEIERIMECINELQKNNIAVRIFDGDEAITMQLLMNKVQSCRENAILTEAEMELEASEIDVDEAEPYRFLWEDGKCDSATQDDYVVIKQGFEYTIMNDRTGQVLEIEDEDINNYVAAMMIMAGKKVVVH